MPITPRYALRTPEGYDPNDVPADMLKLALDAEAAIGAVDDEVDAKVAALVAASPGTLDTLNELAAALGDDPSFAATLAAQIAALPKGKLGYVAQVAIYTVNVGTEVNLPTLTVDVTAGIARKLKVTAYVPMTSAGDSAYATIRIKEGATVLQEGPVALSTTHPVVGCVVAPITPSAGAHTYKVSLQRSGTNGGPVVYAAPTRPAFLLVEDLGPA